MKKIMFVSLVLVMLFSAVSCKAEESEHMDIETFLLIESVALTLEMYEFAADEEYVSYMMQSFEIKEIINNIASSDYSMPEKAYVYQLPEKQLVEGLIKELGDEKISDAVVEKIAQKLNGAMFANMANGRYGSETVAATSMTSWGKSYIRPEGFEENVLIILEYPEDFSSMVSFSTTGEGVVGGMASFIANGNIDLENLLTKIMPVENLEVEIYSKDQLKEMFKNE